MTQFTADLDRETDGRWIAEISTLPGALCYGATKDEASRKVEALALRILADRLKK
jgi:predicted RNase H-like HicB family nuclease